MHIIAGIGFITLGAINGGFGLQLNDADPKYMIVYGVFAALIWVVWMAVSAVAHIRRGRKAAAGHLRVKEESSVSGLKATEDRRADYA